MYSEEEVAYFTAEAIRDAGYEVDLFTKPILALKKIGSRHSVYLLAVIGWRMPRLSGYELALHLSKIDPEIKIVLFSALPYGIDIEFDHLSMPFSNSELLETIYDKIKYGKFDESDIIRRKIRRHRLRKPSPERYYRQLRYQITYLWYRIRYHKRNN